jgi:hypothetical protein
LEKAAVGAVVLFSTEGLSVDFFQETDCAVRMCKEIKSSVKQKPRELKIFPAFSMS